MNAFKNNKILSALPPQVYQRLSDRLEQVQLSRGEIIIPSNKIVESVYFPLQGIVSLISIMQNNSTTEIGVIGREGVVGLAQFFGNGISHSSFMVQVKGAAARIDAKILKKEFDRNKSLRELLLQYNLKLFNQVTQCAACNSHHTVEQRTARWLLMLDDRTDSKTILMTQQLLSSMLGVRRTGITEVSNKIRQQGIIDYYRGEIEILNRPALEAIACECYQIIK